MAKPTAKEVIDAVGGLPDASTLESVLMAGGDPNQDLSAVRRLITLLRLVMKTRYGCYYNTVQIRICQRILTLRMMAASLLH
jgi:hypothetical protein